MQAQNVLKCSLPRAKATLHSQVLDRRKVSKRSTAVHTFAAKDYKMGNASSNETGRYLMSDPDPENQQTTGREVPVR